MGKYGERSKKYLALIFIILIFFLSIIVAWLLANYLLEKPLKTILIYEEINFPSSILSDSIREIDYAIYDILYNNGTSKKDITFLSVDARFKDDFIWEFTRILIKCNDNKLAQYIKTRLKEKLYKLNINIDLRIEEEGLDIICHIFIKDFYTHQILLKIEEEAEPDKKLAKARLAIIVDDLGYNLDVAFSLIDIDLPLSFSLLPFAPFTKTILQELNKREIDYMLHLPMEPKGYPSVDPGPGALYEDMDEKEIIKVLLNDLCMLPGVLGVNNHMGSCFTENTDKMIIVLKQLKEKGLFYIDSKTTSETVGYKLAKELGLKTAKRSVFLDNDLTPRALQIQMERFLNMARNNGVAIGICHPHKETLELLKKNLKKIKSGYKMLPISELIMTQKVIKGMKAHHSCASLDNADIDIQGH